MNNGHIFEQEFKKSLPKECYSKKLRVMSGYKGTGNEGDFLVFLYPKLYIFELKSHRGKSIPFGAIRDNQLVEMFNNSHIVGVICGYIFNFRDLEKTYFVELSDILYFIENSSRKSFPFEWVDEIGFLISQKKVRTRYKYDLNKFFDVIRNINYSSN